MAHSTFANTKASDCPLFVHFDSSRSTDSEYEKPSLGPDCGTKSLTEFQIRLRYGLIQLN